MSVLRHYPKTVACFLTLAFLLELCEAATAQVAEMAVKPPYVSNRLWAKANQPRKMWYRKRYQRALEQGIYLEPENASEDEIVLYRLPSSILEEWKAKTPDERNYERLYHPNPEFRPTDRLHVALEFFDEFGRFHQEVDGASRNDMLKGNPVGYPDDFWLGLTSQERNTIRFSTTETFGYAVLDDWNEAAVRELFEGDAPYQEPTNASSIEIQRGRVVYTTAEWENSTADFRNLMRRMAAESAYVLERQIGPPPSTSTISDRIDPGAAISEFTSSEYLFDRRLLPLRLTVGIFCGVILAFVGPWLVGVHRGLVPAKYGTPAFVAGLAGFFVGYLLAPLLPNALMALLAVAALYGLYKLRVIQFFGGLFGLSKSGTESGPPSGRTKQKLLRQLAKEHEQELATLRTTVNDAEELEELIELAKNVHAEKRKRLLTEGLEIVGRVVNPAPTTEPLEGYLSRRDRRAAQIRRKVDEDSGPNDSVEEKEWESDRLLREWEQINPPPK